MEAINKIISFIVKQSEQVVALGIALSAFTMLILLNVFVSVFVHPDFVYPFLAGYLALKLRRYYLDL